MFTIYNSGHKKRGHPSFLFVGSIRRRRFINPDKKRHQLAHKAYACILTGCAPSVWPDGQVVKAHTNRAAAFTQRIRRSRLRITVPIFKTTKRIKYLKLAHWII